MSTNKTERHDIAEILLKVALNTIKTNKPICTYIFILLTNQSRALEGQQAKLQIHIQGFQSGPVPGTFTRLRSCIVPAEITEPPQN
jgi:hypothetical protein